MAYSKSNVHNVSFDGTSQSQDLSGKAKRITLSASAACYISFDSSLVSATNGFMIPADTQYDFDLLYPSQISVVQVSGAGILSIMELGDSIDSLSLTVRDTFTGDTNLKKTVSVTATGDASLKVTIADTFTGDANILVAPLALTFTGDSSIMTANEDTFSGDANLASYVADTFTGDSHFDV